jgi:hypothetical protein
VLFKRPTSRRRGGAYVLPFVVRPPTQLACAARRARGKALELLLPAHRWGEKGRWWGLLLRQGFSEGGAAGRRRRGGGGGTAPPRSPRSSVAAVRPGKVPKQTRDHNQKTQEHAGR